jgi:hypothetical protein
MVMVMDKRLDHEDGRTVDMLLDPTTVGQSGEPSMSSVKMTSRIKSVSQVLELLGNMPAPEPPVDLLSKTLRRIEEIGETARVTRHEPAQRPATQARPHA